MVSSELALPEEPADDVPYQLAGKRVVFLGKLGSMTKRDVRAFVRERGGIVVREDDPEIDLVILGAEELPIGYRQLIPASIRDAAAEGRIEVVTETEWWQRLGEVAEETHIRQLYTPAMLADLVGVPLSVVRRWHRLGLIVPVREVHRLPYFDFREVTTARQMAGLLAAGVSPATLERELQQLSRFVPDVDRPLAQLAIMAEGRQLLLRQGEGLIDADGQRRFDFDFLSRELSEATDLCDSYAAPGHDVDEQRVEDDATATTSAERWHDATATPPQPSDAVEAWLEEAMALEDEGRLAQAAELYRTIQVMTGPNAEWSFRIAELLYRLGDPTAARERYYMAIELDEDFVEARANLDCVLAELGESELAVAAFEGALAKHPGFPDVQYHLARLLDDLGREEAAAKHWMAFLELAPGSPWAHEARERLGADRL